MSTLLFKTAFGLRSDALAVLMLATVACAHGDDGEPTDRPVRGKDAGAGTAGSGGSNVAAGSGEGGNSGSLGAGGDTGGSGSEMAGSAGGAGDDSADAGNNSADAGDALAASDANDASDARSASDGSSPIDSGPPVRPTGITLGAQTTPTQLETPSNGGIPFNDACPPNQVLIGFKGTVASIDGGQSPIGSVQGVCAPLSVTSTAPYQVKVGAGTSLPLRNVASAIGVNAMCPPDQIVIGFGGRYSTFVDGLDFRCAPLVISGASPAYTLTIGATATSSTIGASSGGTTFTAILCPSKQVAVGQMPHAGALIDAFALSCATPSLVAQ